MDNVRKVDDKCLEKNEALEGICNYFMNEVPTESQTDDFSQILGYITEERIPMSYFTNVENILAFQEFLTNGIENYKTFPTHNARNTLVVGCENDSYDVDNVLSPEELSGMRTFKSELNDFLCLENRLFQEATIDDPEDELEKINELTFLDDVVYNDKKDRIYF